MNLTDTYKHQGLRRQLINELKEKGITNDAVLRSMMAVPRHYFFDSAFLNFAYADKAFPIGAGQTISQPYTVAYQTQMLELTPGMKVLEIGTGSGYQAAVLSQMGIKVFTIERQKVLYRTAQALLGSIQPTAKVFYGDGYKGLPAYAPFDRVLVTCGAPEVPESLLAQLKPGGWMIVPVGEGETQMMTKVERAEHDHFNTTTHGIFRFVPMLPNKATTS